jgi:glycosyltransferase involved in cell wall biosynthesis
MRVLFIINSMSYGGAERQVFDLILGFKKRGLNIHLISLIKPTAFIEELEKHGVGHNCLNLRQNRKSNILAHLKAFINLYQIVKKFKPKIIHSHLFHSNMYARLLSLTTGIKNISSIHSLVENGKYRSIMYRYTDWLCFKTVFVSNASKSEYLQNKATIQKKCFVINNGFDLNRISAASKANVKELRSKYGISEDNFVWLAIGRLVPAKDYLLMLEAFLLLYKSNNNSRLLIVGDGEDKNNVSSFIERNSLDSIVILIDPILEIDSIYLLSDAYISTSKYESFGMTLVEAIIFNLPIVVTKNGGSEEILDKSGIRFLAKDRKSITIFSLMVKTEENYHNDIDKNKYNSVLNKYKMAKILDNWESIYIEAKK